MTEKRIYITRIEWERIHLYIELETDKDAGLSDNVQFYLVNTDYMAETAFTVKSHEGNKYVLTLNVTNNGFNRCIDNGLYAILMIDEDRAFGEVGYRGNHKTLETWGRSFRYNNADGTYTVTFMLDEYTDMPQLRIQCYNMVKRSMAHIEHLVSPVVEEKQRFNLVDAFKNRYRRRFKKAYYQFWHKIYRYKRKKTVLFLSEQDNKPGLNMKCVYNRMKERGLKREYELLQSYRCATSEIQSIRQNFKALRYIAKADIIIVDDHVPTLDRLFLDSEVVMIQLWHAGAGFKGVGYSRWGHFGCPGPFSCHRQYTYCVTGSAQIAHFFSEQFGILDEQIIPTGMPRMDLFLNPVNRKKISEKLYGKIPAAKEKQVILFAPTYRGQNRKTAYYPYEKIDFDELHGYCVENEAIVLFKMHPWVKESVPIREEHRDCFFDLNGYPDINQLFYITDLLITDYSSGIYEFSLMEKPMLFYAFDKEQFATSRGFHRDYDSNVPGKVCESFQGLMEALRSREFDASKSKEYRQRHFDHVDTNNTDRVIDWLILGKLPQQYKDALEQKRKQIYEIRGRDFGYLKEAGLYGGENQRHEEK